MSEFLAAGLLAAGLVSGSPDIPLPVDFALARSVERWVLAGGGDRRPVPPILLRLGCEADWRVREEAHRVLAFDVPGHFAELCRGELSPDAEVRERCRATLRRFAASMSGAPAEGGHPH